MKKNKELTQKEMATLGGHARWKEISPENRKKEMDKVRTQRKYKIKSKKLAINKDNSAIHSFHSKVM